MALVLQVLLIKLCWQTAVMIRQMVGDNNHPELNLQSRKRIREQVFDSESRDKT